jgi:hypothetical protein
VDDLQRPPGDSDREQLAARINRAHDDGRIGAADRDIRLGNVRSAQSMAELDLMTRDLDQLEAVLPPATGTPATKAQTPAAPWSTFDPKAAKRSAGVAGSPRRTAVIVLLVVGIAVIGAAVAAVIGFRSSSDDPSASPDTPAAPAPQDPGAPDAPEPDPPAVSVYKLTQTGIQDFLATYRRKFATSRVVDLTFYTDYVIVDAPVPGKARQSGWLFRNDSGWTTFGGVRATFPGSAVVNTNRLDIPALVRNIARARRTLNVEAPAQAYVIIRFIPRIDPVPSVDIHVANQFQESGYLATTLDGKVQRAYPYDR